MAFTHITSGTTTANAVTTLTFPARYDGVDIVNRSTGDMWVRIDGVDPTIAGDDCFYVPPQSFVNAANTTPYSEPGNTGGHTGATTTVVKLISAANAAFTVSAGV